MYEPGSTFKPLIAAAALQSGAIRESERFDTGEGWVRIGKRVVHEHEHRGHGTIGVGKILEVSSNCGMARIGVRLGIDRCRAALDAFGFGRPTRVGLPGEVGGLITPEEKWTEAYTLVSVSFGQEVAVTPMQLIAAYLPLAGDGYHVAPRIVREPGPDRRPRTQVLSPATAATMRRLMKGVVDEGKVRAIRGTGYSLAGKTGTAQKMKGGQASAYVSSFIGMAPAEDPRLVCLVLLDEPSRKDGVPYGGKVAAPYAAEVMRLSLRYLGVRPEGSAGGP
jgi:cell division protein FtsI/penicillin-binding protein 2